MFNEPRRAFDAATEREASKSPLTGEQLGGTCASKGSEITSPVNRFQSFAPPNCRHHFIARLCFFFFFFFFSTNMAACDTERRRVLAVIYLPGFTSQSRVGIHFRTRSFLRKDGRIRRSCRRQASPFVERTGLATVDGADGFLFVRFLRPGPQLRR